MRQEPAILRRLDLYRQLSDICRSLCVGFVAVAAILVAGIIWHGVDAGLGQSDLRKLGYCVLSLFEAVGMLYRYRNFERQYAVVVLVGYAELRRKGRHGPPTLTFLSPFAPRKSAFFAERKAALSEARTSGCDIVVSVHWGTTLFCSHDPCHLAWQVRKILTGEFNNNATRRAVRAESHSPARRAGRGLALNCDKF